MAGTPAAALTAPVVFWPDASADLVEYLLFPKGTDDRFWAYGYGAIVNTAFGRPKRLEGTYSCPVFVSMSRPWRGSLLFE